MASATATFLFRQFYMTIPNEVREAAQLDGAGPVRFLSSSCPAVVGEHRRVVRRPFIRLNQYFWPIRITNTEAMRTVVIGLEELIPSGTEPPTWNLIMAGPHAAPPPVAVILFMQRWFVKARRAREIT
jgi:sn-glycerol 3-phosphate transport system permease protein